MAEFLASITSEDGQLPFLGDDDGGRFFFPYGPRSRFARATLATTLVTGQALLSVLAARHRRNRALVALAQSAVRASLATRLTASRVRSKTAGLWSCETAECARYFDAGPFGPRSGGHSHSDTLSLIVTNGEQEVLVDSTTYSYMDPEWREVFRGTSAHNIVRIDGPRSGNFGRPISSGTEARERPCWN